MSKTRLCNDSTNQPDYDGIFSDFEPPNTTDGSYRGIMKKVKATEAHLQRKFEEKLEEVKARLKASKCKVELEVSGGTIQLQAILPPLPNSNKVKPDQQLISLGIPANLDGLKTAEEEAYALGTLITRQQFEWNEKYLGTKQEETKVPTIGELMEKFEEEYFKTRRRDIGSETTFSNYLSKLNTHFDKELAINQINMDNCLSAIVSPSSRYASAATISVLCKTFNIPIDLTKFTKKDFDARPRDIPSDEEIIFNFHKYELYATNRSRRVRKEHVDTWKMYRWIYGMIAAYGLRPREVFLNPNVEWWLSPENKDSTWKVDKECKTGDREAFPLHVEWIELFDLKNPEYIHMLKDSLKSIKTCEQFKNTVHKNAKWFEKVGVEFPPYNLRHAWAIRAHLLGIPIKAAADNLGHSVEMHTETYQQWFGRDNRKRAINEAINRKSETELLQEKVQQQKFEIEQLKLELEQSKLENERLRLQMKFSKLSN